MRGFVWLGLFAACSGNDTVVSHDTSIDDPSTEVGTDTDSATSGPRLADLRVLSFDLQPRSMEPGASPTVSFEVENRGDRQAGHFYVSVYLSPTGTTEVSDRLCTLEVDHLATGLATTFDEPCDLGNRPEGSYVATLVADVWDEVEEHDESNNTRVLSTRVALAYSGPDFVPSNLVLTPQTSDGLFRAGEGVKYTVSVTNDGTETGFGPVPFAVVLSDDPVLDSSDTVVDSAWIQWDFPIGATGNLNPRTLYVPSSALGDAWLGFVVNKDGTYAGELDLSNNAVWQQIYVEEQDTVDWTAADVTTSATWPQDSTVSVSYLAQNLGNQTATDVHYEVYASTQPTIPYGADPLCSDTVTIPAQTSIPRTLQCGVPTLSLGSYYILVYAWSSQTSPYNPRGNDLVVGPTVTVVAGDRDLSITGLTASKTTSGRISLDATVNNQGTLSTPGAGIRFVLSTDGVFDSSDKLLWSGSINAIPANGSTHWTRDVAPPLVGAGTYRVLAEVDTSNQIAETNESNNRFAGTDTVSMSAPDIDLEATLVWADFPTLGAVAGDYVRYDMDFVSRSMTHFSGFTIRWVLSTDRTLSGNDTEVCSIRSLSSMGGGNQTGSAYKECPLPVLSPGMYYLLGEVDSLDELPERDETNNIVVGMDGVHVQ